MYDSDLGWGLVWHDVGDDPAVSENAASHVSLYSVFGTPYVAYSDQSEAGQAMVTVWEEVYDSDLGWDWRWHDVGVFVNTASPISLYVDDGEGYTPYVAYSDASLGGNVVVKVREEVYDPDLGWGLVWHDVGDDPAVSENAASHVSLYSVFGTPYVAYREQATGVVKVARFDWECGEWVDTGLSVHAAASPVSLTGTHSSFGLFMSYLDTGGKARVMVLLPPENPEGPPQWKCLGGAVSEGGADSISLDVLHNGAFYTLFVAFKDYSNGGKVTVKMYQFPAPLT